MLQLPDEKLAFSKQMQQAVLGYMMKDPFFCAKCKKYFKDDYFADPSLGSIFNAIYAFTEAFKATPGPEALSDFMASKLNIKNLSPVINDCVAFCSKFPFAQISTSIADWAKSGLFKQHVQLGMKHFQKQDSVQFTQTMKDFLQKASEVNFEEDLVYKIGDFKGDINNTFNEVESDLTTGVKEFDDALGGGLFRGEHTVILAPLGVGKTTSLINFLVANIKREKTCLFITHEGRPRDIVNKIRQRMIQGTRQDFFDAISGKNNIVLQQLQEVERLLEKYLCYIPFNKSGSLCIEDVVDIVRQRNHLLYAKTGQYYDLIFDDYPAKLTSRELRNFKEFRHSAKHCYDQFQQLALEFNCHAMSPVQANREGLKQNRHRDGGDYLDMSVINESLGIAQDASNIISLNRSQEDKIKEIMHFHIVKTRQGPADITITANTDFSRAITHDSALGITVHNPNDPQKTSRERVDAIIGQKNVIPTKSENTGFEKLQRQFE